jgi:hypothetical protein
LPEKAFFGYQSALCEALENNYHGP